MFVPKGQWITGLSVSYSMSNQNAYQFLVFEGIGGDTYDFKVSPLVAYAFKNDMAAGLRFSYQRALTKLESADIVLDSETNYNIDHLYRLSHNYNFSGIFRNYFSLGRSKRFGFFNEVQLTVGGGQSKLTMNEGEDFTGTYTRDFNFNIGLTPGVCVFLSNFSAMEANIGVLGFSYTSSKATTDQIYVARLNSQRANFKINLFSITIGAVFYL